MPGRRAEASDCELAVVGGFGCVDLTGAPVDPGTDAVGAHRQGPVPVSLEAVVPAAEACQVAQDRQADREGDHMVEVAEPGRSRAAGEAAVPVSYTHLT